MTPPRGIFRLRLEAGREKEEDPRESSWLIGVLGREAGRGGASELSLERAVVMLSLVKMRAGIVHSADCWRPNLGASCRALSELCGQCWLARRVRLAGGFQDFHARRVSFENSCRFTLWDAHLLGRARCDI